MRINSSGFFFKLVNKNLLIVLFLAACAPVTRDGGATGAGDNPAPPSISITGIVSTVEVGTAEPILLTELPPGSTQPAPAPQPTSTPVPTLPGGQGPTGLKYRVLAEFPDFFFCDPDFYPVAREEELDLALERFPEIQANPEEFNAILEHNALTGVTDFTDDQKLFIYREHKKLAAIPFELDGSGYRFQIQAAETEGEGERITGLIDGQGTITIQQREASIATCPICLAEGTLIDTPSGPIPVQNLEPGRLVWTLNEAGERVARPVEKVGRTAVPEAHEVVHLELADGRALWISPGHLTADGRPVGGLQAGDTLDGTTVLSAERVPYHGYATYDLLPAGGTGLYWANGILMASTYPERAQDS